MIGALLLAVVLVHAQPGPISTRAPVRPDSTLARAESLLTAGELEAARALLTAYLTDDPNDPHALYLLGRVHLAWPVVGRFQAWHLFERAARAMPNDPAPRYGQVQVGLALGGDDGERLARDAIFHILELRVDYRDIWAIWRRLYEGHGHLEHTVELLARYHGSPADERRAEALIRLERYDDAEKLLARMINEGRDDAAVWALRAEAAYQVGHDSAGRRYYDRAIDRAATDTAGYLWGQVEAIATPDENAEYATISPNDRPAFFRHFWSRREPDLTTPVNERIAEHFERLKTAREQFHILHPESMFHHSPTYRALQESVAGAVYHATRTFITGSDVLPGYSTFERRIQAAGLGVDVRDVPEPDSVTRYARYGFDGRGLLYLRFGKPRQRYVASGDDLGDVESWTYNVDGRDVTLTFARATATASFSFGSIFGGDFVIYPTNQRELHNVGIMLETDESSIHTDFPLSAWEAVFRDPSEKQRVYVKTNTDTAAAAAWRWDGEEVARAMGAVPFSFTIDAGRFAFGIDAHSHGKFGSIRDTLRVPSLGAGWLSLSSLLVGVTDDSLPDRATMLEAMPANLTITRHGAPLTVYTELYDPPPDSTGVAHYELTYAFQPLDHDARPIVFSFPRTVRAEPTVVERLVVQPGAVPPGRYRVALTVRDLVLALPEQSVHADITLR